jgi:hypothetical protein
MAALRTGAGVHWPHVRSGRAMPRDRTTVVRGQIYGQVVHSGQCGQVIDVLVSERRDGPAARAFFTRALTCGPSPVEVTTDRAPVYPRVIEELARAARHVLEQYANNSVEADHGRLKARLPPIRGLKTIRSLHTIATGHAFVQNLRRGHYELTTEMPTHDSPGVDAEQQPGGYRLGQRVPKATRCSARAHMSSTARSATPTDRVQWWIRPGRAGPGQWRSRHPSADQACGRRAPRRHGTPPRRCRTDYQLGADLPAVEGRERSRPASTALRGRIR